MNRQQLEHAIRAACDVTEDTEVWVFGSQAILGTDPDAPLALRRSREVDIAPKNFPERTGLIDGALGELSQFDATFGFYVRGVPIETVVLPAGWKERTVRVQNESTRNNAGLCVESHDLAASKLVAFRDKDREFVRTLLTESMIDPATLIGRVNSLPIEADLRERILTWVDLTVREQ